MLTQLRAVFKSFHSNEVRYVVIGGVAATLHGVPRATFDLDILIDPTIHNATRLLKALEEAGWGTALLTDPKKVLSNEITVFDDRVRIDVQTSTPGITFEDVWDRREIVCHQGMEILLVAKADLIASKRASGRRIDLEDVEALEVE